MDIEDFTKYLERYPEHSLFSLLYYSDTELIKQLDNLYINLKGFEPDVLILRKSPNNEDTLHLHNYMFQST